MRDRVFPWGRVLDEGSSRGKVDEWLHQLITNSGVLFDTEQWVIVLWEKL